MLLKMQEHGEKREALRKGGAFQLLMIAGFYLKGIQ